MSQVPLAYFQVGATAIPTLLVAVAVGLKQGVTHAEEFKKASRIDKGVAVFTVVLFSLSVGVGELAALTALYRGEGSSLQALLVWGAVSFALLLIIMEFITPIVSAMKSLGAVILWAGLIVVWLISVVYAQVLIFQ
ncbi:hypothetical protein [Arthrobacter sp. OY3WO11]|uniref:hypothetical protein n=1 Tax=Arthrobacter sp. OY3WO11 TaxID=1835723 RepID=UPI0012E80CC0|nr:hypothetical protein [Arthrobacter sp. OY3WO11]